MKKVAISSLQVGDLFKFYPASHIVYQKYCSGGKFVVYLRLDSSVFKLADNNKLVYKLKQKIYEL